VPPPANAPALIFGAAAATPVLGFGAPPASSNGAMFGSTAATPAPTFFGGMPSSDPFGGGAVVQTPGASFGFGSSTPVAPQPGGMGGFPMQQPGGFGAGFGAQSNPATPGMGIDQAPQFSIGSGGGKSTGSKRRIVRARRPGGAGAPRQA
jgi:hypothetical protein